jgi:hypothetical protein
VKLWQDLGMKIVGTSPGAFHHPHKGYVDVHVMFQSLEGKIESAKNAKGR